MAGQGLAKTGPSAQENGMRTLRSIIDTPCELDIYDTEAFRVEHWHWVDIPDRKALPMLPEPTPPKRAARPARPQPWGMTPLFSVPGSGEPEEFPPPRRRSRGPRAPGGSRGAGQAGRATSRPPANPPIPASRAGRNGVTGKPAPHKDAAELL